MIARMTMNTLLWLALILPAQASRAHCTLTTDDGISYVGEDINAYILGAFGLETTHYSWINGVETLHCGTSQRGPCNGNAVRISGCHTVQCSAQGACRGARIADVHRLTCSGPDSCRSAIVTDIQGSVDCAAARACQAAQFHKVDDEDHDGMDISVHCQEQEACRNAIFDIGIGEIHCYAYAEVCSAVEIQEAACLSCPSSSSQCPPDMDEFEPCVNRVKAT